MSKSGSDPKQLDVYDV